MGDLRVITIQQSIIGACIALFVLSTSFFVLYTFHATTADQQAAKEFLDKKTSDSPFTGNEHDHMQDVQDVLGWSRVLTVVFIFAGLWAWSRRERFGTVVAGTILIALPVALALLGWNTLFVEFHHLFFPQGNWQFPYDSHIIHTYPPTLFMWFAGLWGGICILVGAALIRYNS